MTILLIALTVLFLFGRNARDQNRFDDRGRGCFGGGSSHGCH
jgi:hypothetical protein